MKPLFFLWARQILNGIKRAVSSPKRLISVLVGLGYYIGFFLRPWEKPTDFTKKGGPLLPKGITFDLANVEPVVFLIFMNISILMAAGVFAMKNTFKPADVDVLFPTPVSSRLVMYFRLFREYFLTLFFPLIILFFGFKPLSSLAAGLKKGDPQGFDLAIRGMVLSWLLMAAVWVALSYALSFYLAKNEKHSRKILRISGWTIALAVAIVLATFGAKMYIDPSWKTIVATTQMPHVRAIMIIPYLSTVIAVGSFGGSLMSTVVAVLALGLLIAVSLRYASNLSGWMYDQAATRGFQGQTMRDMQRKGDMSGMMAEHARSGKVKRGRIAQKIQDVKLLNGWALIYKEWLIQARTGIGMSFVFMLILGFMAVMFLSIPEKRERVLPFVYLGLVGFMTANFGSIAALNGFQETLRRVEVIKPLPLTSRQIAFYEVAAKSFVAILLALVPYTIGLIYKPGLWQFHLAGLIASPAIGVGMVSAVFLVVVLFPDFDDPTQRSFRGLMQLLAMVFVMAPAIGLFLLFIGLIHTSPLVPAVLTAGVMCGIVALFTSLAGRFYVDYNPSE
ncbi:MAG: putative ABC exporter domain-containing protein [Armatimonadota bacterium]